MKKTLTLLLAVLCLSGIFFTDNNKKKNVRAKRSYKQTMARKRPHIEIILPTENFTYTDPGKVLFKVVLIRKSKVRFDIRDEVGKIVKYAYIKESELEKKSENLYEGEVTVALKLGKYYVIGSAMTNLGPDSLAVGPIHFSVIIKKIKAIHLNHIKI